MKDGVLIDTSIWIDYFKGGGEEFQEKVYEILTYSAVYVPNILIAELIQGAKSDKEISVTESFVEAFNIIDQTEHAWLKAGKLSNSMKRRGFDINSVDGCIAILAEENQCKEFSRKEHFGTRETFLRIDLVA